MLGHLILLKATADVNATMPKLSGISPKSRLHCLLFQRRRIGVKKGCIASFVEVAASQMYYCPRRVFLASSKAESIHFEKENSHNKSGSEL